MRTLLLDATELRKDWLCVGLKYQLLDHMHHASWLDVMVPASVFEETIANHARECADTRAQLSKLATSLHRLGVRPAISANFDFDLRSYLLERFDTRLGITILPWPDVGHADLVRRAVNRRAPFDQKGGGYRDSLVWADAISLASAGRHVALVSEDRAFRGDDDKLASELADEVEPLAGSVELVTNLGRWLMAALPWEATDLAAAVVKSRDDEFYNYFMQSDLQEELRPQVTDLGLSRAPFRLDILAADWGGYFSPVGASAGPDGVVLAEYTVDQIIEFSGEFPAGARLGDGWEVAESWIPGRVSVSGTIWLTATIAVLFGGDFGMSVEAISWHTEDGSVSSGVDVLRPDPDQISLL